MLLWYNIGMKNKNINICPHCKATNIIKFGKSKDNNQRYRCKVCKKTFVETRKRTKYTSKEKAFLSMLKNFLSLDDEFAVSIREAIENISEKDTITNNFKLLQKSVNNSNEIHCYNPRLIICEDFNEILIYRLPKRPLRLKKPRTIKIIDDLELKKYRITKNKKEILPSLKSDDSFNSFDTQTESENFDSIEYNQYDISDNFYEYYE